MNKSKYVEFNQKPAMTDTILAETRLENGQTLVLFDQSRKISADAWVVIMRASMEIKITPDLFKQEPLAGVTYKQIRETLGEKVIYEYRLERNFIMDHEKDTVLDSLVNTFMKNTGQYISNPGFAQKLVLKKYESC
ncbi:MAG TPA: hypothetical protein VJ959_05230 [Desulfotignum sp.]|nr:hypothetical protein [Desulfotignum sp.]